MKPKVKVNEARIFKMRRQGITVQAIADAVGTSAAIVRARLLQSGKFPGRVHLKSRFPEKEARMILALHKKAHSLREIAKAVGYSYETVRTVLKNSGLSSVDSLVWAAKRARRHAKASRPQGTRHGGPSTASRDRSAGNRKAKSKSNDKISPSGTQSQRRNAAK